MISSIFYKECKVRSAVYLILFHHPSTFEMLVEETGYSPETIDQAIEELLDYDVVVPFFEGFCPIISNRDIFYSVNFDYGSHLFCDCEKGGSEE